MEANDLFLKQLKEITVKPDATELLKLVITKVYISRTQNDLTDKKAILVDIEGLNAKVSKARELLLSSDIDPSDYRAIKADCEDWN